MIKTGIAIEKKIYLGSPVNNSFSDAYLNVREKEQRVYSDEVVKQLPLLPKKHPQYNEWKLRQKSTSRFLTYLSKSSFSSLLEIGCGNGWFTNKCAGEVKNVVGVDVNILELEQATKLFYNDNLKFVYWDIFKASPFNKKFDCIVLNAVVQYFPDFHLLVEALLLLLNPKGEIHIIDSPFYEKNQIEAAKLRTESYYSLMGVPKMSANYYHHDINSIKGFKQLYTPETSKIMELIKGKDIPFGWYCKTY